jgi:hypothetical protein
MMKTSNRLKTFDDDWPVTFLNRHEMVAAGFYFLGKKDRVRCPSWVVEIENWAL